MTHEELVRIAGGAAFICLVLLLVWRHTALNHAATPPSILIPS
jgi:hypothetical protein